VAVVVLSLIALLWLSVTLWLSEMLWLSVVVPMLWLFVPTLLGLILELIAVEIAKHNSSYVTF
jgi:hypothetical protein